MIKALKTTAMVTVLCGAALFFNACTKVDHVNKAPTNVDVFERAPKSMKVDVTEFSWRYLGGDLLEVSGKAVNNTRAPQPNVTLFAMIFDEAGKPVAMGESAVSPATLPAGGKGTFRIVARTSRPTGIQHVRLLTKAVNE